MDSFGHELILLASLHLLVEAALDNGLLLNQERPDDPLTHALSAPETTPTLDGENQRSRTQGKVFALLDSCHHASSRCKQKA